MKEQSVNIIVEAYQLVLEKDRELRLQNAKHLAGIVRSNLSPFYPALVQGEQGKTEWDKAISHLVERRSLNPIEAWMVAETVAAGVVSAHELANLEPVSDERKQHLTEHLALGAIALTNDAYFVS